VPIGQGTGIIGFNDAAPGTAGVPLVSNGASSDPSFGALNLSASGAVAGTLPAANLPVPLPDTAYTVNTSAPTIDATKCGVPQALGGGTFYRVSVGAASGFPAGCKLKFINTDPWPTGANCSLATGGHGKGMDVNGLASEVLWPTGSFQYVNIAGAWYKDPSFQRVVVPTGTKFCVSLAGDDANDGLSSTSPIRNLNRAWGLAWQYFQSAGGSSTGGSADYDWRLMDTPSCVQGTGANCHSGVHFAGSLSGTEGHNAVMIECDSGSSSSCAIADPTNAAIGTFNSGINVEVQNITLAAPVNSLIQAERGMVRIQGGVVFGQASTSAAQLSANTPSGFIIVDNHSQVNITGGGAWLAAVSSGGVISLDVSVISFQTNVTYAQQTLAAQGFGAITANGVSWVLNGHTVSTPSGFNISCAPGGVVATSGTSASVPGTNAQTGCTLNNNGSYN
jgi:hypothetical protein